MSRNSVLVLIAILAQVLVLTGMVVSASVPLWTGEEVRIEVIPRDPRSLFRGNFARLNYGISTIDSNLFPPGFERLRHGEVVYVRLDTVDGISRAAGVTLDKPDKGLFIRGRLQYPNDTADRQRVNYGIDAYFAPKERALELEKELRGGGIAIVMISGSGKAALQDVVPSE